MKQIILTTVLLALPLLSVSAEWSGYVGSEARLFTGTALDPIQDHSNNWSLLTEPEFYHEWDDGQQSFTFVPFLRIDQQDSERTHADIRELTWLTVAENWELRIGLRQVFWGVAESNHLVDIINQTDLIESLDGEDKLGQPMINFALIKDWGTVDFFVMSGFRERTFPGVKGRLRTQPRVDTDAPIYESSSERSHIDLAVRWSHVMGDFDIGVSHFYGTSRDPRFVLGLNGSEPVLRPYYDIINQTGIDLQATKEDWLWKLEMIYRSGQVDSRGDDSYLAMTGGFEYSFVGAFETDIDVGIVSEYLFDNRDEYALTPFEDDILIGVRLAMNDVQSTDLLAGVIFDRDSSAKSFSLEASRRLGESWKVEFEARFFSDIPSNDLQYVYRNEDYLQIFLARYF